MDERLSHHCQCLLPVNSVILPQPRAFPACCPGLAGNSQAHRCWYSLTQDGSTNTVGSFLKLIT